METTTKPSALMNSLNQQCSTAFHERLSERQESLCKAESDAGYYARMIQDTEERLQSIKAGTPPGAPASVVEQVLSQHLGILMNSRHQAEEQAYQLRSEIAAFSESHPSLIQLQDQLLADWRNVQAQIETAESAQQSDPLDLVRWISRREELEKAIWACEYQTGVNLLLTSEHLAALKPFIYAAYSSALRAGLTESFEHFLIISLAGVSAIRPSLAEIVEAEDAITTRLGFPC